MSKFLYPIYKLNIESYKKWWLYHKKAGGSGILSEILQGFSFNLENTLNRKFKLFEIKGNSVQDGSPSPDNEVPILSSGDNENLFDKNNVINGYLKNDGTVATVSTFKVSDYIDVSKFNDITISGNYGSSEINCFYDENKDFISNFNMSNNNVKTNVIPSNAKYIRLTVSQDVLDQYKLEPGSTATPWSPYGMGSITEKIVNKNFLPQAEIKSVTNNGVTMTSYEDGKITIKGTPTANFLGFFDIEKIKIPANSYMHFRNKGTITSNVAFSLRNDTTNILSTSFNSAERIFVMPNEIIINKIYLFSNSSVVGTPIDITLQPSIELTNEITDYVPHEEQTKTYYTQQPFRSNKDKTVRDCFVKKSDGLYERHYIARYTFTGNELLTKNSNVVYSLRNFDENVLQTNYQDVMSNIFKGKNSWSALQSEDYCCAIAKTGTTVDTFFMYSSEFENMTQAQILEMLTGNYFDYQLAEPLDLPCTEEQIQQLENLPSTYKDFTTINSEDETPAHLKIQYYKEG